MPVRFYNLICFIIQVLAVSITQVITFVLIITNAVKIVQKKNHVNILRLYSAMFGRY